MSAVLGPGATGDPDRPTLSRDDFERTLTPAPTPAAPPVEPELAPDPTTEADDGNDVSTDGER